MKKICLVCGHEAFHNYHLSKSEIKKLKKRLGDAIEN